MVVQISKRCALMGVPNRSVVVRVARPTATRRLPLAVVRAAAAPEAPPKKASSKGHSALMHGLGDVGLIPAQMMPLILRIGTYFFTRRLATI